MMRFFKTAKFKLILWYLVFLIILLAFFSTASYIAMSQITYHMVRDIYDTRNISFNVNILDKPSDVPVIYNVNDFLRFYSFTLTEEKYLEIFSADSYLQPVSTYFGKIYIDLKKVLPEDTEIGSKVSFSGHILQSDPNILNVVVTIKSDAEIVAAIDAFKQSLYISIPITLLLTGLLGYFLVKHTFKPLDIMQRSAEDIYPDNPKNRIPIKTHDEFGDLSTVLNEAFNRMEHSLEQSRQFASETSHELRTPLTILQNETSIALNKPRSQEEYQKTLLNISKDINQLSVLINQLLELSHTDSGKAQYDFKEIRLDDLLIDIAEDFSLLAEQKGIMFKSELNTKAYIKGDEIKLKRLFSNLLDNALKYTPSPGSIKMSLSKQRGFYRIDITDSGKGIPHEHISHVFERFYRISTTDNESYMGLGIGLTLALRIAEAHRGKIEVHSETGRGSKFSAFFPASSNNS